MEDHSLGSGSNPDDDKQPDAFRVISHETYQEWKQVAAYYVFVDLIDPQGDPVGQYYLGEEMLKEYMRKNHIVVFEGHIR